MSLRVLYLIFCQVLGLVVLSLALFRSYAIGVFSLLMVLTGTPAIVYDMPRIQSAAKHVELVG